LVQQTFGTVAKAAQWRGVDFNLFHRLDPSIIFAEP
jgi:hypothetical protein